MSHADPEAIRPARRRVVPTIRGRDHAEDELEFIMAMRAYKVCSGRMHPTWSEVLEVVRCLGYEKSVATPRAPAARRGAGAAPRVARGRGS